MRKIEVVMLNLALFILLVNNCCLGDTITVDQDPNAGAHFTTIQDAINFAWDFDKIVVNPGIYNEHIDYIATLVTITSIDPNDTFIVENTIIDGNGTGNVVTFGNSEGRSSVLEGITVRNGNNGIHIDGADTSPSISKCIITSNKNNGVNCINEARPVITYCKITNNNQNGILGSHGEIAHSEITNNGKHGLDYCHNIHHCIIRSNVSHGLSNCQGNIHNCLISNNLGNGIIVDHQECWDYKITNCTIVGNKGYGVGADSNKNNTKTNVFNSIITNNWASAFYNKSVYTYHGTIKVENSCVWGNRQGLINGDDLEFGENNIEENPYFAKNGFWGGDDIWHEGDYHLRSTIGRWDTRSLSWVQDSIDSLCIDRGDPNDSYDNEPYPNGGRVNMGAYGNTSEASMSEGPTPYCISYPEMDFNKDCMVDLLDLEIFYEHWLECNLDPNSACDCVTEETE